MSQIVAYRPRCVIKPLVAVAVVGGALWDGGAAGGGGAGPGVARVPTATCARAGLPPREGWPFGACIFPARNGNHRNHVGGAGGLPAAATRCQFRRPRATFYQFQRHIY